jgi:hypothetical protein
VSQPDPSGSRSRSRGGPLLVILEVLVVLGALLSRRPAGHPAAGAPDPVAMATGYEHRDFQPKVLLFSGLGLLLVMGLILIAITAYEASVTRLPVTVDRPQELIQGLSASTAPTPPAPRLEAQSGQSYALYRAAQEQKLSSYRWVDRQAGRVAIPIDRAMDLVAQQGLPSRATPTATVRDRGQTSPSRSSSGRVEEAYP